MCTGRTRSYGTCPACGGKGVSARFWCKKCGGEGRARTLSQFRVKIPAGLCQCECCFWEELHDCQYQRHFQSRNCIVTGVDHGSVLRLNGQGDVGTFGAKRGDIMLRFLVCTMFAVTLTSAYAMLLHCTKAMCSNADQPRRFIYAAWK